MPDPNDSFQPFCRSVSLDGKLPAFISHELSGYCKDLGHGLTLELDKIRPETQFMIANLLRDSLDDPMATMNLGRRAQLFNSGVDMGTGIPLPGLGRLLSLPVGWLGLGGRVDGSVALWATNLTAPSKLKVTGITFGLTVYNW
jgi:hypothetical protein